MYPLIIPTLRTMALQLFPLLIFFATSLGASTVSAIETGGTPKSLFTSPAAVSSQAVPGAVRDKQVVRWRVVNIDVDLLRMAAALPATSTDKSSAAATLDLFDDVSFIADPVRCEALEKGLVWIGKLRGVDLSYVVIVEKEGVVSGNITSPKGRYHIRYVGGGVHEVQQVDPSRYSKDLPALPPPAPPAPAQTPPESAEPQVQQDPCDLIDVLVVYTATARAAAGGTAAIESQINLAIAETNQSYQNSGILQRLRLVHSQEVEYAETGDLFATLNCIADRYDGCLDDVALLRETYQADLVSFWVENAAGGECGLAYQMQRVAPDFQQVAFSIVGRSCATANFMFAHQLGHNMGARHDLYSDPALTPFPYAHGYVHATASAPWRTIMATNNACADAGFFCPTLQYWSNPLNTFGGAAMGDATADNHLTLNNTACTVANFRTSTVTYDISGTIVYWDPTTPHVVPGATVSISGQPPVTTDVNGRFAISGIASGYHSLTISKPGFVPYTEQSFYFDRSWPDVTFNLTPIWYFISGTVRSGSPTGPALAGATVSIAGQTTTTGSDGSFIIPRIPPGSYTLTISKSGYKTYTKTNFAVNGNLKGLNFYLTPVYKISGTVHSGSPTGPALAGAVVSIAGRKAVTSSTGAFTVTGIPAGTYTLYIYKSGYRTLVKTSFAVTCNRSGLNFYLTPVYCISGTVRSGSATGPVVAGAVVSIAGKKATTSSTGTFRITDLPAGTYNLYIYKRGYRPYSTSLKVSGNRSGLAFYLTPL